MSAEQNPLQEEITAKAMKKKTFRPSLLGHWRKAVERKLGTSLPHEHGLPILQTELFSEASDPPNSAAPTAFDIFWRKFRFFPWRFDKFTSIHGYLFSIVVYIILLALDLFKDLLNHSSSFAAIITQFHETELYREFVHYWLFLISVVMISVIAKAFNYWRMGLGRTLGDILDKGRISSLHDDGDLQREYYTFLKAYEKDLLSKWRHLYLGVILALGLIFTWKSTQTGIGDLFSGSSMIFHNLHDGILVVRDGFYLLIGTTFATLITSYAFVIFSWVIGSTGKHLKRLPSHFKLNIQPSHPDNCGGLRVFSHLIFGMVLPLLLLTLLMGLSTMLLFTPYVKINPDVLEPLLSAIFLPVVLVLLYIAFFVPLWSIHSVMAKKKRIYEDDFANWSSKLEQTIRTSIEAQQKAIDDQALNTARTAKEEIEILQTIHPDKINYPTWPFNSPLLIAFLIPQIPTLLSLLAVLKVPLLELAKDLLGL